MKNPTLIIFIISFHLLVNCLGQDNTSGNLEFAKKASYLDLYNLVSKNYQDTTLSLQYIQLFIDKALKEKNSLQFGRGLTLKSNYQVLEREKLMLLDSAINITKNTNSLDYPMLAICNKAGYFLEKGHFKVALENYFLSLDYATKKKNEYYQYVNKYNIAFIKGEIGESKDALKIFLECLSYNKEKNDTSSYPYLQTLLSTSEYLIKDNQLDAARTFLNEGMAKSKGMFDNLYHEYLLQDGLYYLKKNKYITADSLISTCLKNFKPFEDNDKRTSILCNYYLGKINSIEGNSERSIYHYKNMDQSIRNTNYYIQEVSTGYLSWIKLVKDGYSKEQVLKTMERFISYDSITSSRGNEISKIVKTQYEIPIILKERNQIINSLKNEKNRANIKIGLLLGGLSLVLVFAIIQYNRKVTLKKKFDAIIKHTNNQTPNNSIEVSFSSTYEESIGFSEEIFNSLIKKLTAFEEDEGFLDVNISSSILAKKMKTNQKYLSKVINHNKGKNFSQYLKSLRIEYSLKWIQENPKKCKQLTIEGIANNVGFKNAESFSLAFSEKTGLKPSYFLKRLENNRKPSLNS